jgi:hypothetical protein
MATKEINRAIIKEQFFNFRKIIQNANAVSDSYRGELNKIDALSTDYTPEYLESQKQAAKNQYKAKNHALYEDVKKQLETLQNALNELHGSLDLSDPALTNALKLIEIAGPDLGAENVMKINAEFATNQPALKVLQAAYKSRGVVYDGNLDQQIYDIDSAIQMIAQHAESALIKDGSVFQFAIQIGKVAKLEGTDFPEGNPFPSMAMEQKNVDLDKFATSARAAAGL